MLTRRLGTIDSQIKQKIRG
ncbi:hypothetical protein [Chlorogloeopsis sp. ULAP02]